MTDFDAIAIIDADSIVLGDLTHVFKLPTDFAWAPDAGPGIDYEKGILFAMGSAMSAPAEII